MIKKSPLAKNVATNVVGDIIAHVMIVTVVDPVLNTILKRKPTKYTWPNAVRVETSE
jgi:hypothetical protein